MLNGVSLLSSLPKPSQEQLAGLKAKIEEFKNSGTLPQLKGLDGQPIELPKLGELPFSSEELKGKLAEAKERLGALPLPQLKDLEGNPIELPKLDDLKTSSSKIKDFFAKGRELFEKFLATGQLQDLSVLFKKDAAAA